MIATSSGDADLTGRSSAEAADVDAFAVNAPNKVLVSGRPIAFAIMRVSNVPDAPTSVPATINRTLPST